MRHLPAQTQSQGSISRRTPYSIRMSSISSSVATLKRVRRRAMSRRMTYVVSSSSGSIGLILTVGPQCRQTKTVTGSLNSPGPPRASRSDCQLHRKRVSRHDSTGCKTLDNPLYWRLRLARRITHTELTAAREDRHERPLLLC
jgi:hypothetical protein